MTRYVVLGANGMVGRAWRQLARDRQLDARFWTRADGDLLAADTLEHLHAIVADLPDPTTTTIVNCVAWTDVDGAEAQEAEAHRLNADLVADLGHLAKQHGSLLLHYSTDYVFPGTATTPIPVDAAISAINAYGRTKAAGEEALRASGARHLIVRTSWLHGSWGKNFVLTLKRLLGERPEVKVVADQLGCPTSVMSLAAASHALANGGHAGTFHVTDEGHCTWYDLAREIGRLIDAPAHITPCTTEQFPRPAPRPRYSVLDTTRTEAILGPRPPWQQTLAETLAETPAEGLAETLAETLAEAPGAVQ